ncbi:MAG: Rieske 2Fe-2S domain-containing protein [Gammaproteobacteria bacterium]|nr:Rieske 2Fe-2S domain-containing protein [Gammaproteobacteria bacterium]
MIPLVELDALPDGYGRRICTAGLDLAVFRVGNSVYAIDDSCPHAGASLSGGKVQGTVVACRAHGLKFSLEHKCPRQGAGLVARTYAVSVVEGMVMLDPDAPPAE